ncbi:MAG: ABC transporter substrate-binding protein [Chloroflexi bacterium]|nr:ABC transporter substrate-binding protein [Chloroflexota bacterium]
MKHRLLVFVFALALLLAPSLLAAQETNLTDGCVDSYDPDVDYFPQKVTITSATGFNVEYFNNYKLVTVSTPWQGAEEPVQYVLVQCGTPAPDNVDVPVIEVPVQRFVSMSTTFIPHIVTQGLLDRVVAVDTVGYTSNEAVLARHEAGDLPEVGSGGSGTDPNIELLVDLEPDLVMTQKFSPDDKGFALIEQAGLPVVLNADFLDTSPLGQAEWGKFIALFFNTEAVAEETFAGVKARYEDLKARTANVDNRPSVFANTPFGDTWYMPGGKSYLAQLLADAGADYLWSDDESTGSLFLDFETVFDRAAEADFWVNVVHTSLDSLIAADERFADFAAVQAGNVYTNNARSNANGSSEYYETGVANPDVILANLVKIFHPDLLPEHDLYYYKQLGE